MAAYCITCGAQLEDGHRFCPMCGAARWTPPAADPAGQRPPPGPGTSAFAPAAPVEQPSPRLRLLPYLFAAGAIFWLIQLAQLAALVAAPLGRDQMFQAWTQAGYTGDATLAVAIEGTVLLGFAAGVAAMHAAAYFGLRGRRPWGWVAALMVAIGWSIVLVGIPVLMLLLRRSTRRAYGVG